MPKTGNEGKVFLDDVEVCDVVAFTINDDIDNPSYVSSKTNKRRRRIPGNEDWNITADILLADGVPVQKNTNTPVIKKGTFVTIEVRTFEDEGFKGPAIIGNIGTTVDIDGNAILRAGVLFEGDGELEVLD